LKTGTDPNRPVTRGPNPNRHMTLGPDLNFNPNRLTGRNFFLKNGTNPYS